MVRNDRLNIGLIQMLSKEGWSVPAREDHAVIGVSTHGVLQAQASSVVLLVLCKINRSIVSIG